MSPRTIFTSELCPGGHYSRGDIIHSDTGSGSAFSCDPASGVGIGAVLEQKHGDHVKPIAYYSRKLADRETRYGITELEALAVHQAMRHFAIYLLGSKTTVYTDHKALTFLKTMKNSSPRVARWWVELQQYDLEVCYRRGADNVVADTLSRDFSAVDPAGEQVHSPKGGGGVGTGQVQETKYHTVLTTETGRF